MESVLDQQLEIISKSDLLFKVEKYFNQQEQLEKVDGAPFYLMARNIHMGCPHIRQKHIEKQRYLYCVLPEHVEEFNRTGAKIISCQNCHLNKN